MHACCTDEANVNHCVHCQNPEATQHKLKFAKNYNIETSVDRKPGQPLFSKRLRGRNEPSKIEAKQRVKE